MGGAAACIGLLAEMNAPDAEALSILLPAGGGNATQINILEGNIIDPQFGLGGNTSNNSTIGGLMMGQGNDGMGSTGSALSIGPIALGGANGNGNVTQINILSYNIINPQMSLLGGNLSNNTTVSDVAMNNGNDATATSTGGSSSLLGGAIGNGNTTQLSLFSGNIFNPQISLFGTNISNNEAISNVAAENGNGSTTGVTSGGLFGTSLFGQTGNGNTIQYAGFASNIFNPQVSLLGGNQSNNDANANQATGNGNSGDNGVGTTGSGLGNIFSFGNTGNGNTTQNATGAGNIYNDQFNLGLGTLGLGSVVPAPQPTTTPETPATVQTSSSSSSGSENPPTNEQVTGSSASQSGLTPQQLLQLQNLQPGSSSQTGTVVSGRSLQSVAKKIKDGVSGAIDRLTKPNGSGSTASDTSGAS